MRQVGYAEYMNDSKRIRAVAYARCSKVLNQDVTLQTRAITEVVKARGFDFIDEYIDQVTGDRERRPGLDRLIADAKAGKFNVVVVTAIDRIFRSTKHMLNLIDELEHFGVSVISIRESLDFTSPAGRMALTVLAAVATLEKSIISERIKTSLAVKKLTAERTGSGWRCGRKPVATDDVVEQVLALRRQGKSVRQIEAALNKKISRGSVQRILDANRGRLDDRHTTVHSAQSDSHSQVFEIPQCDGEEKSVPTPVVCLSGARAKGGAR